MIIMTSDDDDNDEDDEWFWWRILVKDFGDAGDNLKIRFKFWWDGTNLLTN